jgi:hypothetical protein
MKTRSQTRNKLSIDTSYSEGFSEHIPCSRSSSRLAKQTVDVDFDGASREWRKNKQSMGNGCYSYK